MSTGLFIHKTRTFGPSRGYIDRRTALKKRKLIEFAEALANGAASIRSAGREVGINPGQASKYFREICGALGEQAR